MQVFRPQIVRYFTKKGDCSCMQSLQTKANMLTNIIEQNVRAKCSCMTSVAACVTSSDTRQVTSYYLKLLKFQVTSRKHEHDCLQSAEKAEGATQFCNSTKKKVDEADDITLGYFVIKCQERSFKIDQRNTIQVSNSINFSMKYRSVI